MAENADQARTRRRWISLAEFVAVAGLLIGVATLYLNWSDRREERAEKAEASVVESKAKAHVLLTGTVAYGGKSIVLSDGAHTFSAATVRFPKSLSVAEQDAMPGPTIQAAWFADKILALTDKGADERSGRLPALVSVTWWDGDVSRTDTALYDVLWRTEGRVLQGRKLVITGLALVDRTTSPGALDRAWAKRKP